MLDLRKNGSHILENIKIKIESVFVVENSLCCKGGSLLCNVIKN
jgi:hypothetical protein